LHVDAPPLRNVPSALGALISECLFKSPGARPGAQNIVARLGSAARAPASPGLARLQQANMQIVAEKSEGGRIASVAQSEAERRTDLLQAATASFQRIGEQLKETINEHAPQASIRIARNRSWNADLKSASLVFSMVERTDSNIWGGWEAPAIDVIGYGSIEVSIPRNRYDYEGRSHSLWFCDAKEAGRYGWFEAAFMITPGMRLSYPKAPFALDPGEEAAKALWSGMAEFQMAWPFTQVIVGELDEFIDRWIGWFAQAAEGSLNHPSMMPERDAQGSWRR
jgi:serine/threonine-protein kinase